MIQFPGVGHPLVDGQSSKSTLQGETTSSVVTNRQGQTISARLTTSYSYTETRYSPTGYSAPVTYSPPSSSPPSSSPATGAGQTSVSETQAVGDTTVNPGAATILAFIEQRLVTDLADGATAEELQSRLQAGFEGFMQGFSEAKTQLEEMGLFDGEVKSTIDRMFNDVVNGFAELADKYELENPAADVELNEVPEPPPAAGQEVAAEAAPVVAQSPGETLNQFVEDTARNREAERLQTLLAPTQDFYSQMEDAQLDKEESESRLFNFQLRTTDGDLVNIRSYSDQGQRTQVNADGTRLDQGGMNDFRFSVEGDLDVDELRAINDLLSQLNEVASTFFEGDVYDAYEKALEVGFDSNEIARFSLNLTQVEYSRVTNTYGSVAQAGSDKLQVGDHQGVAAAPVIDNRVARLGAFIQQLENLRQQSEHLGFSGHRTRDLAEFVARPQFGQHPRFGQFKPFMGEMLGALQRQS